LSPKVLDLNLVVAEVARMLPRLIGEDVKLRVVQGEHLESIKVDPAQIEQIILNLAVNARDAMPEGGTLTLETSNITLDATRAPDQVSVPPGDYVLLAVTDTGTGMSEETRKHLFEPFFTTKEIGKGTGLGLSTIYGIVKQSDGNIWVDSEPGQGTSFKICFPKSTERPEAVMEEKHPQSSPSGRNEIVLLVEDEHALRMLASRFLESKGYRVLDAADPEEALGIVRSNPGIDLLLTDIVMPGMSGADLAKRLLPQYPKLKVIYVSGYSDVPKRYAGSLASEARLLPKPYALEALAREVRNALDEDSKSHPARIS
jgi:two-component system cell cycle sensor histidine kinase/response regulator CckA